MTGRQSVYPDLVYDPLVFAPGICAPDAGRSPRRCGSEPRFPPDPADHRLYEAIHPVEWSEPACWTELAERMYWWNPPRDTKVVTICDRRVTVANPTSAAVGATILPGSLSAEIEVVDQERIAKLIVSKPNALMWDRSDLHLLSGEPGSYRVLSVVGLEAHSARRLARRLSAGVARARLQVKEFIEEADARWLEKVAAGNRPALELDWAWLYELPATR